MRVNYLGKHITCPSYPYFGYPYLPGFNSRDLELNVIRLAFEFGGQLRYVQADADLDRPFPR